jgi:PqqD family protein of HPr-rel-A system
MTAPLYVAASADTRVSCVMEGLHILYDRASGATHILAEPSPEILAALANAPLTEAALIAALSVEFDLADQALIGARLAELQDAGLIAQL